MALTAEILIFQLHGTLLRELALATNQHFEGLEQAARYCRKTQVVDNNIAKRLTHLDHAFNFVRHITNVKAPSFLSTVRVQVAQLQVKKEDVEAKVILKKCVSFNDSVAPVVASSSSGEFASERFADHRSNESGTQACDDVYDDYIRGMCFIADDILDNKFILLRNNINSWPPFGLDSDEAAENSLFDLVFDSSFVIMKNNSNFPGNSADIVKEHMRLKTLSSIRNLKLDIKQRTDL